MTRKHEQGWAIAGKHGLYEGWCQTRVDMIAHHVHAYDLKLSDWAIGKLDVDQRKQWTACKKKGDRVVKVTLTYV